MEGQRVETTVSLYHTKRKARRLIEIDSFKKYEELKEAFGHRLESKTMSSPVLKQYIDEVPLSELNLSLLCSEQNLKLDNFMMLFEKNQKEQVFSDRSLFHFFFDSNKINDGDYTRLVNIFIESILEDRRNDAPRVFAGHRYGRIALGNEISYKVAKESLIYAVDSLLNIPLSTYEDSREKGRDKWIKDLDCFIEEISDAIKTTYIIPKEDRDFIVSYLFGGKIVESDKSKFFNKDFLGAPYGSMHESFFDKLLIQDLFDQVIDCFGKDDYRVSAIVFNPYLNAKYYESIKEKITMDEVNWLLRRVGESRTEWLISVIFGSKAEIDDEVLSKYSNDVDLRTLIESKAACDWIEREGKTEEYFERVLKRTDPSFERVNHSLGELELSREQIINYMSINCNSSYERITLTYKNLMKLELSDLEKYSDNINVNLSDLENVNELPVDTMVNLLKKAQSRREIFLHKSISKENPISLAVTRRVIQDTSWGLSSVYYDIVNGEHYELDEELLNRMIDKMGSLKDEFKFIEKMDGSIDELIEFFSKKEMI